VSPPEIPPDLIEFLNKASNETAKIYKRMLPQMEQAASIKAQASDALKKSGVIEFVLQLQEKAQKYIEQATRIIKERELKKEAMIQSGWWFSPSSLNISAYQINAASSAYNNGDEGAITRLFKKVYHQNNYQYLNETVEGWQNNKLFAPWMEIIKEALEAHREKRYSLSVPALLLTAEGIATDYCEKEGGLSENNMSRGNKKIKKLLSKKENTSSSLEVFYLDLLFEIIDQRLYKHTKKLKKSKTDYKYFLNRHAVLHGLTHVYGSPENSLQCFMLLDVLAYHDQQWLDFKI